MAHVVEDEKFLKARRSQERFALLFSNAALIFVMFMPGQAFPRTAKLGFLCGLLLLDVLYILVQLKFHGDSAALKADRTCHTLYYVAWGMVGIAMLLVILNSFGLFRRGPEFALYDLEYEEAAVEEIWGGAPGETASGLSVTSLLSVDSRGALEELLAGAVPSGEGDEATSLILRDFPEGWFEEHTLYCAALSSGRQGGQIAAEAGAEEGEAGRDGIVTVYFHPGEDSGQERRYLFFLKLARAEAASYSGWTLTAEAN